MDFLLLLDKCVVLCDSLEGELVHEVDAVGAGDELLAKALDGDGEGSAEQTDLVFLVALIDNLLQDGLEFRRK